MRKKLEFYRIRTGITGLNIYDPTLSDDYREKYLEKENKLGVLPDGKPYVPEHFQTQKHIDEGWIGETAQKDDDPESNGYFDTEDMELAARVMKAANFQAGLTQVNPNEPGSRNKLELNNEKLMAFYRKILDKQSPTDVLDKLEEELKKTAGVRQEKTSNWEKRKVLDDIKAAKRNKAV